MKQYRVGLGWFFHQKWKNVVLLSPLLISQREVCGVGSFVLSSCESLVFQIEEKLVLQIRKRMTYFAPLFNAKLEIMSENIQEQIKEMIVEKLAVKPEEVTMDASFTNDLGADSLDTVELMMDFEKKFNLAIPDDQQEKIVTVGDVVRLVEEMQKSAGKEA